MVQYNYSKENETLKNGKGINIMKYGYKEHKYITMEALRRLCIKHNFYLEGDNIEYYELLESVRGAEMDSDKVVEIAQNIVDHSSKEVEILRCLLNCSYSDVFLYIMSLIGNACDIEYIEV